MRNVTNSLCLNSIVIFRTFYSESLSIQAFTSERLPTLQVYAVIYPDVLAVEVLRKLRKMLDGSEESSFDILASLLQKPPISIEILPGDVQAWVADKLSETESSDSTFPFLFVERNLGVPQKSLYRLYLKAVAIFHRAKKETLPANGSAHEDLIASSSIILLANPAHQTALNARKRLVQRGLLDSHRELEFTAALLTVRDCAKQSILWHHRRWLFHFIYQGEHIEPRALGLISFVEHSVNLPPEVIQREMDIISRACEIYPRNYYAWTHWQFCIRSTSVPFPTSNISDGHSRYVESLLQDLQRLRNWVQSHISDHTAVHNLGTLVLLLHKLDLEDASFIPSEGGTVSGYLADLTDPRSTSEHAISLVKSYPEHESLWMYLRCTFYLQNEDGRRDASEIILPWIYDKAVNSRDAYRFLLWGALQAGRVSLSDPSAQRIIAGDRTMPEVLAILEGRASII